MLRTLNTVPCFQDFPCQSVRETPAGGGAKPSHHTPPSLVSPTLVKTVFLAMVDMAWGLVLFEVPGATPKKPFSGLMALSFPGERGGRVYKGWLKCLDQINTLKMQHGRSLINIQFIFRPLLNKKTVHWLLLMPYTS